MFPFFPQNRFVLEGSLEIHNGGQNARFGSSLAPVPDLNGDGFNDLVVGAPLEDDHKGAIYVFFSQHNRILRKYKQVGTIIRFLLTVSQSVPYMFYLICVHFVKKSNLQKFESCWSVSVILYM